MSTLMENPIIIVLLVIGIGMTIVFGVKFFEEYGLNKQLRLKQKSMRLKATGLSGRQSMLGALALTPAFLLVIGLFVTMNMTSPEDTQFIQITSSEDIFDIYEKFTDRQSNNSFLNREFAMEEDFVATPDAEADAPTSNGGDDFDAEKGSGSDDYSETNNQVDGVDEYDNVVTDGKYIYTMNGGSIQISLAYTNEYKLQGFGKVHEITYDNENVDCESSYLSPIGMYVEADKDGELGKFVVVASEYYYYNWECSEQEGKEYSEMYWYDQQNSNTVKVLVYDKSDWSLEDEYTLNGYFTGTRKIGDDLYVVTNKYLPLHDDSIDLDSFLPEYSVGDESVQASYEQIIYNDGTSPNTFTTFYGISLDTKEVDMEVILGDSGYNLYVSGDNMYLTGTVWYSFPEPASLFDSEPEVEYEPSTSIMKVAINDGKVEFDTVGNVKGHSLNQFSMDEYNGHLRITTTTSMWGWGEDINNRLYILDEDLNEVSVIENIGLPGETIRSTRFVGDYAYVVTFEMTDPFYVFNLSDPENPYEESYIKIDGFSTYIQPINDDFMLGVGFDADPETGWVTGLKLEIYDVTDKSDPKVLDTLVFNQDDYTEEGWSWIYSSITYNHKDLLLDINKGILAFPISYNSWNEDTGYSYSSGVMVYNIDLINGFSDDYSYIEHEAGTMEDYNWRNYINVYKTKYIHDSEEDITYLYTVSNKYLVVHSLEDLSIELDRTNIFSQETYYWDYYYEDVEESGDTSDSGEPVDPEQEPDPDQG